MPKSIKDKVKLANGVEMPWFGLGVYKVKDGEEVINAVKAALECGYIHIDTATLTKMKRVGKRLEIWHSREEVFITSKVWNDDQGLNPR